MRTIVVLLFLLVAGCAQPETEVQDEEPESQYTDPTRNITVDAPSLPTDPPEDGERTLNDPPVWRLGEYWEFAITDHLIGESYTATRVVAGTEHGNYLVGFPLDDFKNDVMVLHTPGYGDINKTTLGYEAHDVPFEPLQFPLTPSAIWSTAWECESCTGDFLVESIDTINQTAQLSSSATGQGGPNGNYKYNAEYGEFEEFHIAGYISWTVVEHGYNYEGPVRVPHAHDLVFFHGRIAQVGDVSQPFFPPAPALPLETITVAEGYDRLSFALISGDLTGQTLKSQTGEEANTATIRIVATSPQGDVYEHLFLPNAETSLKVDFLGHEEPAGDWQLEVEMAGAGIALLEGIGYHSIDIDLPSGCVRESTNAMHHGTLCRD